MRFLFILCILLSVSALPQLTYAQNIGDKVTKKSDMSDIPDDYIIEASKFGEECRNHREMPLYFNCQCLAVTYLDHRIDLGPEAHSSAVRNMLGGECKDGTGIAGKLYEECLNDFVNAPKHLDPETFCSCYSNTFSKYFESSNGEMNPRMKLSFLSRSRLQCQNPEAARKIYGIR